MKIPNNAVCVKCNRNHRLYCESIVKEYAEEISKIGGWK